MSLSVFTYRIHLAVVVNTTTVVVFVQRDIVSFRLNDNEDSGLVGTDELVEWQITKVHLFWIWRKKPIFQSIVSGQMFEQLVPFILIKVTVLEVASDVQIEVAR